MTSKEKVEKALYSYTAEANDLEEENRILRETVSVLKPEIDKLNAPEHGHFASGRRCLRVRSISSSDIP